MVKNKQIKWNKRERARICVRFAVDWSARVIEWLNRILETLTMNFLCKYWFYGIPINNLNRRPIPLSYFLTSILIYNITICEKKRVVHGASVTGATEIYSYRIFPKPDIITTIEHYNHHFTNYDNFSVFFSLSFYLFLSLSVSLWRLCPKKLYLV